MHDRFPEAIEEEVELLDLDLASYVLEWHARVPGWRDFYLGLDQTRHYAYLKKVLQALTFLRGPQTWVLKSPQHAEQLGPLMATFPDATVAFTHRDPVAVIQSAITMMAYSDRLRRTSIDPRMAGRLLDRPDPPAAAAPACATATWCPPSAVSTSPSISSTATRCPCSHELYARAGVEITPKVRRGDSRPTSTATAAAARAAIPYDLQRHFGVSPQELRSRFGFYFDRFDVRPEI